VTQEVSQACVNRLTVRHDLLAALKKATKAPANRRVVR
jgi:hypothetical protein